MSVRRLVDDLLCSRQPSVIVYRDGEGPAFVIDDDPDAFVRHTDLVVLEVVPIPGHVGHEVYFALGQVRRYTDGPDDRTETDGDDE